MQSDPRNDAPFTPPPTSAAPTVLLALVIGVAVFAGFRMESWWSSRAVPESLASGASALVVVKPAALNDTIPALPQTQTQTQQQQQQQQQPKITAQPKWTRCEVGGRVEYSDTGCVNGVVKSSSRNTQALLSVVQPNANNPEDATTTVYRCKAYSGVVFWSTGHCNQKKALVERMVTVPTGMPLKEQIVIAERALKKAAPGAPAPVQRQMVAQNGKALECKALEDRIRYLDAEARQPLSGQRQDQIRSERQDARSRQFVLRC